MTLRSLAVAVWVLVSSAIVAQSRPNIVFIAIDDLRTDLGCYGVRHVSSPHIDRLAREGVRFDRAYCQQAICGPSRASLLTGLRPDSSGVHGNHTHFRSIHNDLVTLPQWFKEHGWDTRSFGKIWHGPFAEGASRTVADTFDDPRSWSVKPFKPGPRYYWTEAGIAAAQEVYRRVYRPTDPRPDDWTKKLVFGPATEAPEVEDARLYDGRVARAAVRSMQEMAAQDRPFFLAVGFIKPHSPYVAPKRWFDEYDASGIGLATQTSLPAGAPRIAGHGSGELRRYTDQPARGPIAPENQRRVRHAYLACTSYVDAQVGLILDELDRLELADDTVVVLWSDHGYHLGEKGLWGKTTNFERDARVPLIVKKPGAGGVGRASGALVELVDLYPTLVELAGHEVPTHLEGTSFAPLLDRPDRSWKPAAFTQFTRGRRRGYSIRTDRYRYTEWLNLERGGLIARELYDHETDPDETRNLANAADHSNTVAALSRTLDRGQGWRRVAHPVDGPDLQLHPVFTNGMVLQRDRPIRIFGTARPGTRVSVTLSGGSASGTTGPHGRWDVVLGARPAAAEPITVRIRATLQSATQSLRLDDVLVGEVWICSGQSNMRWRVKQSASAADAVGAADPQLRLLDFEGRLYPTRRAYTLDMLRKIGSSSYYTTEGWRPASTESVSNFSAVSYFFGAKLRERLGVPVGLIHDAIGGVPMESYIPRSVLARDEALAPCLEDWLGSDIVPAWCRERARFNLRAWFDRRAGPLPHHPFEPGFLAAASTERLAGLSVRGFLWYQGESNATHGGAGTAARDPAREKHKLVTLIRSWRALWKDETLPFYFVQLPGLDREWTRFRELQLEVEREVSGTGMAVITDLGHPTDVHPLRKKPVGRRLARLALSKTYGLDLVPTGPRHAGHSVAGGRMRVRFDYADGLAARGGREPDGFEVAGEDRVFHPARAVIDGDAVVLSSPAVKRPVAARYGWCNDPAGANLVNGADLPASPFRTDDWELQEVPVAAADDVLGFEGLPTGVLERARSKGWELSARRGHARITEQFAHRGKKALHIVGGGDHEVVIRLPARPDGDRTLAVRAERWTRRSPFAFRIDASQDETWTEIFDGDATVAVGARFLTDVRCRLPSGTTRLRLRCRAPHPGGILLDDLRILPAGALPEPPVVRDGVMVRAPGQDGVHTYRIPGLATTNKGTLIAVYDVRRRSSGDLPGDVDVGMSRSRDGGLTWEPMKIVLDMGDDPAWRHDGVGDPAVLVDRVAGTIWVAATWSHGNRAWRGSGPGLGPEETGQLVLVRSDDDGLTWGKPINITRQVKRPEWRYVLQGPGKGITMRDGTLVFAAQFRSSDASEHRGKPFSTIIWSKDRGRTWSIGSGVKVDTTEAQVVELRDGALMINCRDNRGGARSVYTTRDLGRTWKVHPTSRKALPEPVCMASLIGLESARHGRLLIFSNPATTRGRHHMTIKVSRDDGTTWPKEHHTLYDARPGFGYSCLTRIDEDHVGVLYETRRGLRFVRFRIARLIGAR